MKNIILTSIGLISMLFVYSCEVDDSPISVPQPEGAIVQPEVGGATQPNQVFVDLDLNEVHTSRRDSWDFGFYADDDNFYVILNNSIMMAATDLPFTDINAVTQADVSALQPLVAVSTFQDSNINYVDDVPGVYENYTAIKKISANDAENPVHLVNMGYYVSDEIPTAGSVVTIGDHRGWKKIRVLRNGSNGYTIQYADINATTYNEINVTKNNEYHFTFLSLQDGIVNVQPPKNQWDLCFTVFTNYIEGNGTYIYADFVTNNIMSSVGAYQVLIEDDGITYEDFTLSNVDASRFIFDDQRVIGSNWRTTFGGASAAIDRFYVLQDNFGTRYKIKFLSLTHASGERGFPQFEFDVL